MGAPPHMPTPPQSGLDGHGLSLRGKAGRRWPRDGRTVGGERGRLQPEEGLGTQPPPLREPRPHQAGPQPGTELPPLSGPASLPPPRRSPPGAGRMGVPTTHSALCRAPPTPTSPLHRPTAPTTGSLPEGEWGHLSQTGAHVSREGDPAWPDWAEASGGALCRPGAGAQTRSRGHSSQALGPVPSKSRSSVPLGTT